MKSYVQTVFDMPDRASLELEALIEAEEEARQQVAAAEALYAVQAVMAPSRWPDEDGNSWHARARANRLVAKEIIS